MDGWEPHLHWSFRQEHVLLPSLVLHSFSDFIVAGLSLALLCLVERCVILISDPFSLGLVRIHLLSVQIGDIRT